MNLDFEEPKISLTERPDDGELLRRTADKDLGAFTRLVERFQARVLNLCAGLLDNRQNAEDVAQEVFFQVYRSAGKFRHDCLVSTWIFRIAINRCRNFKRDNRKFGRWGELHRGLEKERREALARAASDAADPESVWEENETRELIREAITLLPEKQRTALILNKLEGYSYKEIAEILDVSLSSVEACLHRAKINLQRKLAPHFLRSCRDRKF